MTLLINALLGISHAEKSLARELPIDSTDICKARIHSDVMINVAKYWLFIVRDEIHFVEEVETLDINRWWKWFLVVIDKPGCNVWVVSWWRDAIRRKHHVYVQGREYRKIFVGAILGVDEETPPLSSSNAYVLSTDVFGFYIHSIDLHSSKGMAIEVNCMTRKVTDVDNMDKIGFTRLDRD